MKSLLLLTLSYALLHVASAAPLCINGSLASYEALGAGGCMIGANTVASFLTVSGITGATPIAPNTISIMPTGGTTNPQLMFSVSQTAGANATDEAIFTYMISGPAYLTDVITLAGSSETGNGAVTDTQNYCAGGHFGSDGVTGCTGSATGGLVALDGIQNSDNTGFASPHSLAITDDFVLDSGGQGTASGGAWTDQFTATAATPEPGGYLLTGTGLLFAILRRSRAVNQKS